MKHVKSTDPRKKAIVAALKEVSKANKVTLVKEGIDGIFTGHCLSGGKQGYTSLGMYTVRLKFVSSNVAEILEYMPGAVQG